MFGFGMSHDEGCQDHQMLELVRIGQVTSMNNDDNYTLT